MKFEECFADIVKTISEFLEPVKQLEFIEYDYNEVELTGKIFIKLGDESNWFRHDARVEIEIDDEFKIYVIANFHWEEQKVSLFFYRKRND